MSPRCTLLFDGKDLQSAVSTLQSGGIILYPTDTVWGIGCDATNERAVKRIFDLKQRADSKAMLVLLDSPLKLNHYVKTIPDIVWDLIEITSEPSSSRPLTIIYPQAQNLAPSLIADDGSIGIRLTQEIFSKTLCAELGKPIVSTSANISGMPTPHNFLQIVPQIRESVDYVCYYRRDDDSKKAPSSILKLNDDGTFRLIRM